MPQGSSLDHADRRIPGRRRRRRERWAARLRPALYGLGIDAIIIAVLLVAQRRTQLGLSVLSRRVQGETDAQFPRPRFLGNGNIEDFEKVAAELEEIRRADKTDAVTGLPGQTETRNMLLLYSEVAAMEGARLSACVADLDHFKVINDTHGHAAGDEVLRQLGDRVKGVLDSGHPIGRWGGDEFLLLFPRTDLSSARELAEEVRSAVEGSPFGLADGTNLRLTVTLGVASASGIGLDANRLFMAADGDLIEAKQVGRNRVGLGRFVGSSRTTDFEG